MISVDGLLAWEETWASGRLAISPRRAWRIYTDPPQKEVERRKRATLGWLDEAPLGIALAGKRAPT